MLFLGLILLYVITKEIDFPIKVYTEPIVMTNDFIFYIFFNVFALDLS